MPDSLDRVFDALANEHRREAVYLLGLQPWSISGLASQLGLSLPAFHRHVKALEGASLVVRRKVGRTNYLALDTKPLRALQEWTGQFQTHWGSGTESLDNYTEYLLRTDKEKQ